MTEEIFPIVNTEGEVVGSATREECHAGTFFLHPVVHLHIFNSAGELYLQKRVMTKKIQPGKWDTAVGGHVDYGERIEDALLRETHEELGVRDFTPDFLMRYEFRSQVEAELVYIYKCVYDGDFNLDPSEVDEGRFWSLDEIKKSIGKGLFTPNFESEIERLGWLK
ncbi:MAG: NUDIX domain-containing protein [Paludibacteraceae bacterium]|nr:NUDIX domain-containing protein [Paludibacteraceae bacterium]